MYYYNHDQKFGDALSAELSHDLITGLSMCQFPFICAHGRRSTALVTCLSVYNN